MGYNVSQEGYMPRTSPYEIELSPQDSQGEILSLDITSSLALRLRMYAFVYFPYLRQARLPAPVGDEIDPLP